MANQPEAPLPPLPALNMTETGARLAAVAKMTDAELEAAREAELSLMNAAHTQYDRRRSIVTALNAEKARRMNRIWWRSSRA